MGKFDGKFLRGTIGASVFKEYRGMQVVQGKSQKKAKLTAETKKAATVFGRGSTLAAYIRGNLNTIISDFYDGTMIFRFTTDTVFCVRSALIAENQTFDFNAESFKRLIGFEFNAKSPLKNYFFAQPVVQINANQLTVNIPEMKIPQDLKFPKKTRYCKVVVCNSLFDLVNGFYKKTVIESFDVEYLFKPSVIAARQINFETEPGCLCVVSIGLQYYQKTFAGNSVLNNKKFNPSAILFTTITEGGEVKDRSKSEQWYEMTFKAT